MESYASASSTADPVEDLQPATFFQQGVDRSRKSSRKIFKLTPYYTPVRTQRKLPRLVFRTGTFRVEVESDKVVLELLGFEDRLYIIHFLLAEFAWDFMLFIDGTGVDTALRIAPDLRAWLQNDAPQTPAQNDNELPSTAQSDEDDPRTLQLAFWG